MTVMTVPTSPAAKPAWQLYDGKGIPRTKPLPPFEPPPDHKDAKGYRADPHLRDAVNVALLLGQPLLLTGEPGTGKSQLAWSIAYELLGEEPLVFHTKSTSVAGDLFYRYDAMLRFHDAQPILRNADPTTEAPPNLDAASDRYITFEALGTAIRRAMGEQPQRSVVLVDEVDKAPRDFPNDILNEIDTMEFTVKESGKGFCAQEKYRPIVVMTSNSEKDLPDAFLRRCVFYHIPFPDHTGLLTILESRLKDYAALHEAAITHFEAIRALKLKKNPATAELIAWVRLLHTCGVGPDDLKANDTEKLRPTYGALLKTEPDREKVLAHAWPKPR